MCVDASCDYSPDSHYRADTLKLISIIQVRTCTCTCTRTYSIINNYIITCSQSAKKPIVIALTKCDRVTQSKIIEVNELLSKLKRAPQIIEVSSHDGVNIDSCFLTLAHNIDSHKPRVRLLSYDEASSIVKERKGKNEKFFKAMLDNKLTDFTMSKTKAVLLVKKEPEWEGVAQLLGSQRCERLVNVRLGNLHIEAVMKQTNMFKEMLPEYLSIVLPQVTLQDTAGGCLDVIKNHDKFEEYFIHINNWTDDVEFLHTFSNRVPFSFIEKEGTCTLTVICVQIIIVA